MLGSPILRSHRGFLLPINKLALATRGYISEELYDFNIKFCLYLLSIQDVRISAIKQSSLLILVISQTQPKIDCFKQNQIPVFFSIQKQPSILSCISGKPTVTIKKSAEVSLATYRQKKPTILTFIECET